MLIEDGWTLNEDGEPFDPEVDTVRYKDVDGELMSLTIRFAKVEGNEGADLVVEQLSETLPALGFEFIVEESALQRDALRLLPRRWSSASTT